MSLFGIFSIKKTPTEQENTIKSTIDPQQETPMSSQTDSSNNHSSSNGHAQIPDIPEKVFVEFEKPKVKDDVNATDEPEIWDLRSLHDHLSQNFDKKGFEDALMNPDTSYMNENIEFIRNDINLLISKIKNYYRGYLSKIEFHIESRKRNGMIETVEELVNFRKTIEAEMEAINSIEEDTRNAVGLSQNLILSYKKGFKNGFAAITYNTILNRKS